MGWWILERSLTHRPSHSLGFIFWSNRMKPNALDNYNPNPDYLRSLIEQASLTQTDAAKLVGVDPRTMRRYLAFTDSKNYIKAPYAVQYCLERLANKKDSRPIA
mgnify:CR=1 FL=1